MKVASLVMVLLVVVQPVFAGQEENQVLIALNDNQLMPQFGKQLDIDGAYRIQQRAISTLLAGKRPDGFKAGLTSSAVQTTFAVSEAVAGVLLTDSHVPVNSDGAYVIGTHTYQKPMLELEIGFRMAENIDSPIADIESLKRKVGFVVPVIELPDLGFTDRATLLGTDIIANNVAARNYIVGTASANTAIDINQLAVALYHDGKMILAGQGSDAMGDQWQALLWLVNQTLASGWQIQPGQLLITGALGKMLPLQPGSYRAEFAELGQIEWHVK